MRTAILENNQLRVVVLLDSGARIIEFIYKLSYRQFLWEKPRGIHERPIYGAPLETYWGGGWDDAIPTVHPCVYKGVTYPDLGEVCSLPWSFSIIEESPDEVAVHLWVSTIRAPLRVDKWMTLREGEKALHLKYKITNLSDRSFDFLWAIHPMLQVSPEHRIDLPAEEILVGDFQQGMLKADETHKWPYAIDKRGRKIDLRKIQPKSNCTEDIVYVKGLKEGWFTLTDTKTEEGFGMKFPTNIFKFIALWLNYGGWLNYYVVGIEPRTGYPERLDKAVEVGEYSTLEGGTSLECEIKAFAYSNAKESENLIRDLK